MKAVCAALLLLATPALAVDAAPRFPIGSPVISGSGCGPATATINQAGDRITVAFSHFEASAAGGLGGYARCMIAIPLRAAPQWRAALESVEYLGATSLTPDGSATLDRVVLFAGAPVGPFPAMSFRGTNTFNFVDDLPAPAYGQCSTGTILRVQPTLRAEQPAGAFGSSSIRLDADALAFGIVLHLRWESCI
jgi:hypothetical protein